MSQILSSFATLLFPFGYGAGQQVAASTDGKAKVHGSASKWSTYLSLLLWVTELTALIFAAIFTILLHDDIRQIDDKTITGEDSHTERLNTNLLLNSIVFTARAIFVGIVVLVNLSTCTFPAVASTAQSFLFCGNIWDRNRVKAGSRRTCLLVWFFIEQVFFLAPLLSMVMLTMGDISTVLSKSCLQLKQEACGWDCVFAYNPLTTFEEGAGHTFRRPVTSLFVFSYLLYFSAAGVRLIRNSLLYIISGTMVGNNVTTHNSISTDGKEVQDIIQSTLSGASKVREEITYNFGAEDDMDGLRKRNTALKIL